MTSVSVMPLKQEDVLRDLRRLIKASLVTGSKQHMAPYLSYKGKYECWHPEGIYLLIDPKIKLLCENFVLIFQSMSGSMRRRKWIIFIWAIDLSAEVAVENEWGIHTYILTHTHIDRDNRSKIGHFTWDNYYKTWGTHTHTQGQTGWTTVL